MNARPAAVAGAFYPGDAATLAAQVKDHLAAASPQPRAHPPKAIIAPHAGYIYSAPIAAPAYALLRPLRDVVKRVVIVGPAHRVYVAGAAVPTAPAFETPLGRIPIDAEAIAKLLELPFVESSDAAHALEHCLEVHLPFLQAVLGGFSLVPIVVGEAQPEEMAEVLEKVWGGPETLVVVSSDLSHYLSYDAARKRDRATTDAILAFDARLDPREACGAMPINGLLTLARRRGMALELLDLRNSGDTAGDRSRVVGYASFALYEK
jgi:AmmeMemoRadiSam system protein B